MTPRKEVLWLHDVAHCETNYRTIASRAYYACFTRSFAFAVAKGWLPSGRGEDHGGVISFLRASNVSLEHGNLRYRIGSSRLPKLKKLRREADYLPLAEFTAGDAQAAVELMTEILDLFDQIDGIPRST